MTSSALLITLGFLLASPTLAALEVLDLLASGAACGSLPWLFIAIIKIIILQPFSHVVQAPSDVPGHGVRTGRAQAVDDHLLHPPLVLEVLCRQAVPDEGALAESPQALHRVEGAAVGAVEDQFHVQVLAVLPHLLRLVHAQVVDQDVQGLAVVVVLPQHGEPVGEVVLVDGGGPAEGLHQLAGGVHGGHDGHGFEGDLVPGLDQLQCAFVRPDLPLGLLAAVDGFVAEQESISGLVQLSQAQNLGEGRHPLLGLGGELLLRQEDAGLEDPIADAVLAVEQAEAIVGQPAVGELLPEELDPGAEGVVAQLHQFLLPQEEAQLLLRELRLPLPSHCLGDPAQPQKLLADGPDPTQGEVDDGADDGVGEVRVPGWVRHGRPEAQNKNVLDRQFEGPAVRLLCSPTGLAKFSSTRGRTLNYSLHLFHINSNLRNHPHDSPSPAPR